MEVIDETYMFLSIRPEGRRDLYFPDKKHTIMQLKLTEDKNIGKKHFKLQNYSNSKKKKKYIVTNANKWPNVFVEMYFIIFISSVK